MADTNSDDRRLHERMGALFLEALRVPVEGREDWVRQSSRGDERLALAVLEMLAHDSGTDPFVGELEVHGAHEELRAIRSASRTPPQEKNQILVEGFDIRAVVGHGGTSVVYRALQKSTSREVALKVLRPGLASPQVLRRLAQEAEVLGQLDHPAIARVFDAGVTEGPGGPLPYLAMELVHGMPLTVWAQHEGLDTQGRVKLLVAVCDGIDHAHRRGIVHRDIKPDNIMVDENGQPKVLDFGIARILEGPGALDHTALTEPGQLVGTLAWMSPEQARADGSSIDARSDVYALGLLGFLLLSGQMPFATEGLTPGELLDKVTRASPRRLGSVERSLRGDLDTILDRCLRKRRADRYPSVAQLRGDLASWLDGNAILARPPSLLEQLRRVVAEHRLASSVLALVVLGLGALLIQQAASNRRWQARAEFEHRLSLATTRFLDSSLGDFAGDPENPESVVDLFRRAEDWADENLSEDPGLMGAFLATVSGNHGGAMQLTTLAAGAGESLARAVPLLEDAFGPEDDRTLAAQVALACQQRDPLSAAQIHALAELVPGVFPDTHELALEARALLLRDGFDRPDTLDDLRALIRLALTLENRHVVRDAWLTASRVLPPAERLAIGRWLMAGPSSDAKRDLNYLQTLTNALERDLDGLSEAADWQALHDEVVRILDQDCPRGEFSRPLQRSYMTLGARALLQLGRVEEALPVLENAAAQALSARSKTWPEILRRLYHLAAAYRHLGRLDEALAVAEFATRAPEVNFPETHPAGTRRGRLGIMRGKILAELGRLDEAEAAMANAMKHNYPSGRNWAARAFEEFLAEQGRWAEVDCLRALESESDP
jgi:serine/threonine protein kinase/tetratricopeptide (TPR) repeat protein